MATSTMRSSRLGRNSWSGGSSVRMTTGKPFMAVKRPAKSLRCMGRSFNRALRRLFSSRARIMACICSMRSSAKNMRSVRHSPMPSAPNLRAVLASRGISALARTPNLPRNSSAHSMKLLRTPEEGSASMVLALPAKISPVEPSSEIQSPSVSVTTLPPMLVDGDGLGAGDAGGSHAAADDGGVAGHATARGEDALGDFHAVDIVGHGFLADQYDGGRLGGGDT